MKQVKFGLIILCFLILGNSMLLIHPFFDLMSEYVLFDLILFWIALVLDTAALFAALWTYDRVRILCEEDKLRGR